jgi:predicted transcriptional regulator
MPDLFGNPEPQRYPDAPGHRGVDTSIEAAETIAGKLGTLQQLALRAIHDRARDGLTFEELAEAVDRDFRSIQPRVSELRKKGLVVDSGLRRFNASRRRAIVFVVPEFKQAHVDG